MERSHRELSIDIVIHRGILKDNQLRSSPVLPSYLKQGLVFTVKNWFLCR